MSETVKIFRIECPTSGKGMYKFMSPLGRRNHHPSSYCPTPSTDRTLVDFLCEVYCKYYKNGYKSRAYGSFYDYGSRMLHCGPKIGRDDKDCPWNFKTESYWCMDNASPWHFGFANMDQLLAWMDNEDIKNAINHGLVLSIYEVHKSAACLAETQALFFRPCARVVEQRSLKKLLTPRKKDATKPVVVAKEWSWR